MLTFNKTTPSNFIDKQGTNIWPRRAIDYVRLYHFSIKSDLSIKLGSAPVFENSDVGLSCLTDAPNKTSAAYFPQRTIFLTMHGASCHLKYFTPFHRKDSLLFINVLRYSKCFRLSSLLFSTPCFVALNVTGTLLFVLWFFIHLSHGNHFREMAVSSRGRLLFRSYPFFVSVRLLLCCSSVNKCCFLILHSSFNWGLGWITPCVNVPLPLKLTSPGGLFGENGCWCWWP